MNSTRQPAFHGSDLEQIETYYKIPKEEILCFSANVNPLGIPLTVRRALTENPDVISRYPDREYTALKRAISQYCGVDPSRIVTGNGSTELISLLISQRQARHALVIGPTYSEYERELSLTGGRISFFHLGEDEEFRLDIPRLLDALAADTDLLILCNPNNPTSSAVPAKDLAVLAAACRERDIFIMIDETYADFAPSVEEISAVPLTGEFDNLMVIRGVSKFFAAPGLRLGYGITSNQAFLQTIRIHQNPWSVNSVAAFAGEVMLKDTAFIAQTRHLICRERERITEILSGFSHAKAYPAWANFFLVKIEKEGLSSFQVFDSLIRKKIMIRDCSSFESLPGEYIRFCILNPEDNDRLLTCLRELLD